MSITPTTETGIVAAVKAANAALEMSRIPVTDAASYEEQAHNLQTINGFLRDLDAHRRAITRPIDDAKAQIMDLFRPFQNRLEQATTIIKSGMSDWYQADLAAKREAERLAAEAMKAEQERLAAEARAAEEAGDIDTAINKTFEASMAAAPIVAPQAAKVSGISHRETWSAEVTNLHALVVAAAENPQAYLMCLQVNQTALNGVARNQKGAMAIPGVRAVSSATVAAGRR